MIVFLLILAMAVTLALAAFCAGAETAFLSVSRERILHMSREGGRKAKIVHRALSYMSHTTTTLLIGNNLAAVAYSAASAALSLRLCSGSVMRGLWSFAAAFLVLYVSEFLPKLLCAARPLRRSLALADAYEKVSWCLSPLTAMALKLTNFFVSGKDPKYKITTKDLVRILQDRKDGVCLSDFESALIGLIIVNRTKGKFITTDALMDVLRDPLDGNQSGESRE